MPISRPIRAKARSVWADLLDIILPRTCLACGRILGGREPGFQCLACRSSMRLVMEPQCPVCGVPYFGKVMAPGPCPACLDSPPAFAQARSLFLYRGSGARLIQALKYEHATWVQAEIAHLLRSDPRWSEFFHEAVLVPVPLHRARERTRGYNQAVVIASAIRIPRGTLRRASFTSSDSLTMSSKPIKA